MYLLSCTSAIALGYFFFLPNEVSMAEKTFIIGENSLIMEICEFVLFGHA